ncbi:MAG: hypothetical protein QOG13_2877 [Sphingomonadales bacterium]|jgi:hypothetical protein|nr:hypothetical protein [Sphingomonadales bacterium]
MRFEDSLKPLPLMGRVGVGGAFGKAHPSLTFTPTQPSPIEGEGIQPNVNTA